MASVRSDSITASLLPNLPRRLPPIALPLPGPTRHRLPSSLLASSSRLALLPAERPPAWSAPAAAYHSLLPVRRESRAAAAPAYPVVGEDSSSAAAPDDEGSTTAGWFDCDLFLFSGPRDFRSMCLSLLISVGCTDFRGPVLFLWFFLQGSQCRAIPSMVVHPFYRLLMCSDQLVI